MKEDMSTILDFEMDTFMVDGKELGYIRVEELLNDSIKEVKFVESGKFVENGGNPALKVIGSLSSSNVVKVK